jgi:putative ABC transport system permease protein
MRAVRAFLSRLSGSFAGPRRDRDLAEELDSHLQMQIEHNLATGMGAEEAGHNALLESGGLELSKEACRDRRGLPLLDTPMRDLAYNWREVRRTPGFSVVVVLTLALGIGANTVIFGIVNAFLLRPLPFEKEDELVSIYECTKDLPEFAVSGTKYLDWRARNTVFQDVGALQAGSAALTGHGEPAPVTVLMVTPSYLRLLGVRPTLGRLFADDADLPGRDQVVLLGNRLWKSQFGGREDVVGQPVRLNGRAYSIAGVLPQALAYLDGSDTAFVPLAVTTLQADRGHWHSVQAIARLKPGVSVVQGQAAMSVIARQHERLYEPGWGVVVKSLRRDLLGGWPDPQTILLLQGAVLLVLLVACANTASLLLARSVSRRREIAIRLAMGGSRFRIIRQLLVESVLLSSLGGAAGVMLAAFGLRTLEAWIQTQRIALWSEVRLDAAVLGFSVALSLVTGIVFGLVPAAKATREDPATLMKGAGRSSTAPGRHRRTLDALAVAQIGLALVLLIGAGLVVRSLIQIHGRDPGFQSANVLTMRVTLPEPRYSDNGECSRFFDAALERIRAVPSVRSASVIHTLPMEGGFELTFAIDGRRTSAAGRNHGVQVRRVSPEYFRTMGVPVLQGRALRASDRAGAESVVIVNECLARRYFRDTDAVGAHISISDGMVNPRTIVGIVRDERVMGITGESVPMLYVPYDQGQWQTGKTFHFLVRTFGEPLGLSRPVQDAVRRIDPDIAFANVRPMEWFVSGSILPERIAGFMLGSFSAAALLVAVLGIYGVMANGVSQRRREIAIRIALGARARNIIGGIMSRGLMLTVAGLSIGLAATSLLTRVLRAFLHGVSPTDPLTFVAVTAFLALVAMAACWLPAHRAASVDPAIALRDESE